MEMHMKHLTLKLELQTGSSAEPIGAWKMWYKS